MTCEHKDFGANVKVQRMTSNGKADGETLGYRADISIVCSACHMPAIFACDNLSQENIPYVNPLGHLIHLPMFFFDMPKIGKTVGFPTSLEDELERLKRRG